MTKSHNPEEQLTSTYKAWGNGGWGGILTGNVQVDGRWLGQPHDVLVEPTSDPEIIAQWRMYAEACRQSPLGAGSKGLFEKNIAPSPVPLNLGTNFLSRMAQKLLFGSPREMTVTEIEDLVQRFANAAKFLSEAGFDGVELHVAHGYLLSLFLSPTVNQRTDAYGGSPLNRVRIILDIIKATRAVVPSTFAVGLKLNSVDIQQSSDMEEAMQQVQHITEVGIDFLEISGGSYEDPQMMGGDDDDKQKQVSERTAKREGFFLDYAREIRKRFPSIVLMVTGGFRSLKGMHAALGENACDLIGVARPAAIDPAWASKVLKAEAAGGDEAMPLSRVKPSWLISKIPVKALGSGAESAHYGAQIARICKGLPTQVPSTATLLPFLYQTSTIQQWHPATRPAAQRNITSRSRQHNGDDIPFEHNDIPFKDEDIPFEGEDLPPVIDQEPGRKTTITGSERAAFEKLYRKFNTEGRRQKEKDHIVELDQIADEYYEDDEDTSKPSLDEMFNEAMSGEPRLRAQRTPQRLRSRVQPGDGAQVTDEALNDASIDALSSKRGVAGVNAEQFIAMRTAERYRVDQLIRNAPTDHALWQILEREVFAKVRELDLDNPQTEGSAEPTTKPSRTLSKDGVPKRPVVTRPAPPSPERRILFQNYPHHLICAVATLRLEFPGSSLPLAILPTIKSLGRSSLALGATTSLYRQLLRTAWIQQGSYTIIDTLLTDMDRNVIEFDSGILLLLNAIIKEHRQMRGGLLSPALRAVYSMDMLEGDFAKIVRWRDTVAERLGMKSEEKRSSNKLVRTVPREAQAWKSVPLSKDGVNAQMSERQHNAFDVEASAPEKRDGGRDIPQAQGAQIGKDLDDIFDEAEANIQDTNSASIEESSADNNGKEKHDAPNETSKATL
ncbi:nadh:flavin oxidoreductase nadh oxidase [Stemphylium lycopersici]|nr:nadh:flavin oxidoreductase nadh oxidase [Stemphylium lycopersici]